MAGTNLLSPQFLLYKDIVVNVQNLLETSVLFVFLFWLKPLTIVQASDKIYDYPLSAVYPFAPGFRAVGEPAFQCKSPCRARYNLPGAIYAAFGILNRRHGPVYLFLVPVCDFVGSRNP